MTDYDPAIYSDTGRMVYREDGTSAFERATWRELAEELRQDVANLRRFQRMVTDLDRNEHGRHEGDADVGDPTGVSQGNPRLKTGDVLGYSLSGTPYVVPERGQRHDPTAWGAR